MLIEEVTARRPGQAPWPSYRIQLSWSVRPWPAFTVGVSKNASADRIVASSWTANPPPTPACFFVPWNVPP